MLAKEFNNRLADLHADAIGRALQVGRLLETIKVRLDDLTEVLEDAYVTARLDPEVLRSVSLEFGKLPVKSVDPARLGLVHGAALHFAESTSFDLVYVIYPYSFDPHQPHGDPVSQDPRAWDVDERLPELVRTFLDVAIQSHPHRCQAPGERAEHRATDLSGGGQP